MFGSFISMFRCCRLSIPPLAFPSLRPSFSSSSSLAARYFSKDPEFDNSSPTQNTTGSSSNATFPEGCDYEHWFVLMEPPKGYPLRHEIIEGYIQTLAMVLGSVEAAKQSIYSVSTKYYYAFGCRVPGKLTSLPNVRWVLPDSYLNADENDYGGEPFVDGEAVPYEEKYHATWLWDPNDATHKNQVQFSNSKKNE